LQVCPNGHLTEVAEKLFAGKGFTATSVRDIAHEAGVNLAMISYYFGSKDKLMETIFEHRMSYMKLKMENLVFDKEITPVQKINLLVDAYIDRVMSQDDFHRLMNRQQLNPEDNPLLPLIFEVKRKNHDLIKALIQQGQKAGIFRRNIDIPLMMSTLIGTVGQVLLNQNFYRNICNHQKLGDEEYKQYIKRKLKLHLKSLFKAVLIHES
jgi:AcrR family transcriptional regulator